jgi:hypothetical protein
MGRPANQYDGSIDHTHTPLSALINYKYTAWETETQKNKLLFGAQLHAGELIQDRDCKGTRAVC